MTPNLWLSIPARACLLALASVVAPAVHAQAAAAPAAPAASAAPAAPAAAPLPPDIAAQIAAAKAVPPLLALGRRLEAEDNWPLYEATMKRVSELRPFAGNIRLELAAAYAMQDNKPAAYETLLGLRDQGFAFDIAADQRMENLHGTEVWTFLVDGLKENGEPKGSGRVVMQLPAGDLLVEALAWDAPRKSLLVGSVRSGEISRADDFGKLTTFIKPDAANGLWGVFEMVADPAHDALWVASAAIPHVRHAKGEDYGRAGVFRFELSSGKFISRAVLARDGRNHLITGLAVAPDGSVYAADSQTRQIFKVEGETLRVVVDNQRLTSIRGLAITSDGKTLYFSDHELGLFGIELATAKPFEVKVAKSVAPFGIESLYWQDNSLVAVQNGMLPVRIVRLVLTPDGRGVLAALPIDSAQPEFGQITRGALAGDRLYTIANSQKGGYDRLGVPRDLAKLERIRIWISVLNSVPNPR
jgi:hypothetical protein